MIFTGVDVEMYHIAKLRGTVINWNTAVFFVSVNGASL